MQTLPLQHTALQHDLHQPGSTLLRGVQSGGDTTQRLHSSGGHRTYLQYGESVAGPRSQARARSAHAVVLRSHPQAAAVGLALPQTRRPDQRHYPGRPPPTHATVC